MSQPNFLLFITDQHRADHLGAYGNPQIRTPALDALARRGWLAERFYVASPICMPNRATLMTGRMPSAHGARHNGIPLSQRATRPANLPAAPMTKTTDRALPTGFSLASVNR
ncbi:type I phosphodiesterase/nucleotide pyrophosphatase domain protein [Bordetella bronchiseptica E014]|nr:type I phosphodiesterase/nucleotide pyrophosphatase domain protein [Bordetella bronchiseptica E014]